jgi:hypothetical protein
MFSETNLRVFDKFVQDIKSHNIVIELVMVPYHPIVYGHMSSNKKYRMVDKFEDYVSPYAEKNNLKVRGSFNPSHFNLLSSDFYDGMHMNENGIAKVFGDKLF